MPANTSSYNFFLPVVGGDSNAWGGFLNSNWQDMDDILAGLVPVTGIDINNGTIDGTPIGVATPAAGAFTTLSASGAVTIGGVLLTATATEINYTDGVTSPIQTQLNGKQALDATLTALAGLTTSANKLVRATGVDTFDLIDFLDQDDMASNSATAVPSQQSVKAYVDGRTGTRVLAMCSFNGTGSTPISVAANGLNVTNVTKNGDGDYTINFTTNLPHANYAVNGMSVDPGSDLNSVVQYHSSSARTVSSVRVTNVRRDGTFVDSALITITVVG